MAPPPPERGPSDDATEAILTRLASRADPGGFVRFDRFLEVALYSPGVGYYSRPGRSSFGRSGDFYTAAHVHSLFAQTLAHRILTEHRRQGAPGRFRVVEVGPGDGSLAQGVMDALVPSIPEGNAWEFVLVERSGPLRRALEERFGRSTPAGTIDLRFAQGLGADGPFVGVVYANELLDALPCRRLVWSDGNWQEQGVRERAGRLVWDQRSLDAALPGAPVPDGLRNGAVFEVGLVAEAFVREVADNLARGCALMLDFGYSQEEVIAGHPTGTLVSIRRHEVDPDPLARPGDSDLSVFVNFTRLRAAAKRSNLSEVAFRPMAEALSDWGFGPLLLEAEERTPGTTEEVKLRLAAKNLLFGFPNFHVLELAAGGSSRTEAIAPT